MCPDILYLYAFGRTKMSFKKILVCDICHKEIDYWVLMGQTPAVFEDGPYRHAHPECFKEKYGFDKHFKEFNELED